MKKVIFFTLLCLLFYFPQTIFATDAPSLGVIRMDMWFNSDNFQPAPSGKALDPPQWHYRIPFFVTKFKENGGPFFGEPQQSVMDKEIQFARATGISYFAFNFYALEEQKWLEGKPNLNYGLHQFITSEKKGGFKFAIILVLGDEERHGTKEMWDTFTVPTIAKLTSYPSYMTVDGSRPIVYIYGIGSLTKAPPYFSSISETKSALNRLRQKIKDSSGNNPYIITANAYLVDRAINDYGLDAVSDYSGQNKSTTPIEVPFAESMTNDVNYWNENVQKGYQVVPNVSMGFDPRTAKSWNQGWYARATPNQITTHLQKTTDWINSHNANTSAKTMLICCWNEYHMGAWINPTIYDGDTYLQAISKVRNGNYFSYPRYKGSDLNSDRKIDILDYNILLTNFGMALDPIPTNADITGDGKVNIFDYNTLVANYGK